MEHDIDQSEKTWKAMESMAPSQIQASSSSSSPPTSGLETWSMPKKWPEGEEEKEERGVATNRNSVSESNERQSSGAESVGRQSLVVSTGKWQLTCPGHQRCCSPSTAATGLTPDSIYGGCLGVLTLAVTTLAILFYRHTMDNCRGCPPWSIPEKGNGPLTYSQEGFREQFQLELNAAEHILTPIVEKIILTNYRVQIR